MSLNPEVEDCAEYWRVREEIKRLERHLEPIEERLKREVKDRQVGNFWVTVKQIPQERVDTKKVLELLGEKTPMAISMSTRLTVKYAPADLKAVA